MGLADVPMPRCKEAPAEAAAEREELVHRVASSSTFERSPRLRAFFLHVCRCALDNKPEGATEQQVGICVYDRPPGYNPNEDNIVRSQARLLRLKLEHHFANEGKDEAIIITIPKGRYLPAFETRSEQPEILPCRPPGAGQIPPFTADPGWSGRAVRTRDYLRLATSCISRDPPLHRLPSLPRARSPARIRARLSSRRGTYRLGWPPAPAKSVSPPVIQGLLMWTCGGAVGKRTVTTKEAFPSLVRSTSFPLWPMKACSRTCGKPSPPT